MYIYIYKNEKQLDSSNEMEALITASHTYKVKYSFVASEYF